MSGDWHQDALEAGRKCHDAALEYLRRGWSPLPLCPPDHVGVGKSHGKTCSPGSHGKAPMVQWKEYQTRRPREDELASWWHGWPNANVGIAMGPVSGLVGVDVDGEAGEQALRELSAGNVPPTLEFSTGKGRRLLFSIPAGVTLQSTYQALAISEELRLLGEGAQTVAPPSRHQSGSVYAWVNDLPPALAPDWLVKAMSPEGRKNDGPAEPLSDGEVIKEGKRNATLTSMAGTMRRRGFCAEAIRSALTVENERCEPPLPTEEVEKIARSVGRYSPDVFAGVTIKLNGHEPRVIAEGEGIMAEKLHGVEPQPVYWLVKGYLPLGKLVLIAGDGGHGKSTLTLALAADLSKGRPAFGLDYPALPPADTLIACCEDDYADTVVPRLMAHGADLHRVHRILGVKQGKKLEPFSLAHYEEIETELVRRPECKLIVVDPAGAYIGRTGIDDYKDSELRALLGPLSDLAAKTAVTILLVKHLVKGATTKAVHKVGGSAGYVNAVRAAYVVSPSQEDPDLKLFLPLKFNLGPRPAGLSYRLEGLGLADKSATLDLMPNLQGDDRKRMGEQLFKVGWKGEVQIDADDALAPPPQQGGSRAEMSTKLGQCIEWMRNLLVKHPVFFPSVMVEKRGLELGFKERTWKEARKRLKDEYIARSEKVGGRWFIGPYHGEYRLQDENALLNLLHSSPSCTLESANDETTVQEGNNADEFNSASTDVSE